MSGEGRGPLTGLGGDRLEPSVGLGAKGQLRAEEMAPSWGDLSPRPTLWKTICACPGQGPVAQVGVHTTAPTFLLTMWG